MKKTALITKALMVLVSACCLITWSGLSETWAKGAGGKSKGSARVTASPVKAGATSTKKVSAKKKKSSGDRVDYMKFEMKDAFVSSY